MLGVRNQLRMIAYAGPAADFAQTFVNRLLEVILFPLVTLLLVIALVVFLYGCFEFVAGANNPQAREKGRQHILYGLIGLLVMLSAYAILSIAVATFGIDAPGEPGSNFAPRSAPTPQFRSETTPSPVINSSAPTGRFVDDNGCIREADGQIVPNFRDGC